MPRDPKWLAAYDDSGRLAEEFEVVRSLFEWFIDTPMKLLGWPRCRAVNVEKRCQRPRHHLWAHYHGTFTGLSTEYERWLVSPPQSEEEKADG